MVTQAQEVRRRASYTIITCSFCFIVGTLFDSNIVNVYRYNLLSSSIRKDPAELYEPATECNEKNGGHFLSNNTSASLGCPSGTPWCPAALCMNSPLCQPCKRRFLVILATGRSASTTLTYMLDLLPGVRMGGENKNTLKLNLDMIDNVRRSRAFQWGSGNRNPWGHNEIPAGAFACVAQTMIETIYPPKIENGAIVNGDDGEMIVGFKTIRFLDDVEKGKEEEMVNFLKEMFPCLRVLVNIRSDVQTQAESMNTLTGFKRSTPLDELNDQYLRVAQLLGDSARVLDSSKWTRDISLLNEVVDWLGFDESCAFTELLEFNTENGYGNGQTTMELDPRCRYRGRRSTGA